MIAYLLHQLPEAERAEIAERIATDPDLHEEIEMAEAELFDRYVRADATARERSLIEQHLLTSPYQRRKLDFSSTLRSVIQPPSRQARPYTWFATAAVVVLAAATAWLAFDRSRLAHELVTRSQRPTAAAATHAAFVPLDTLRSGARDAVVAVPSGVEIVRLDLEIDPSDAGTTMAAIVTQSGRLVWRTEPVVPTRAGTQAIAPLWLPSAAIVSRDALTITLEAHGQPVAAYRLRIER